MIWRPKSLQSPQPAIAGFLAFLSPLRSEPHFAGLVYATAVWYSTKKEYAPRSLCDEPEYMSTNECFCRRTDVREHKHGNIMLRNINAREQGRGSLKRWKLLVIGGGSVGLLASAKLALSGADVTLLVRTEHQAEAIRVNGLRLSEDEDGFSVMLPCVSYERLDSPETAAAHVGPADYVLLAVKQQHLVSSLIEYAVSLAGSDGRLLCFQNGIGHVEALSAYIAVNRIDIAVTTEGAHRLSAFHVAHTGRGITRIGCADGDSLEAAGENAQKMIRSAMNLAGFETVLSKQVVEIMWNKLLLNAVINPLTALLRLRNGELPASAHGRDLMRLLLQEGAAAAAASGIQTRDDLWGQLIEVCERTADNESSMLQDITRGRTTEIEWINGALVRAAQKRGVPVPGHEMILKLVKAAEAARRLAN